MGFIDDLKKTAADAQRAIERQVDKMQQEQAAPPEPPPLDGAAPVDAQAPPPVAQPSNTSQPLTPSAPAGTLPAGPQVRAVEETLPGSPVPASTNPLPPAEPRAE